VRTWLKICAIIVGVALLIGIMLIANQRVKAANDAATLEQARMAGQREYAQSHPRHHITGDTVFGCSSADGLHLLDEFRAQNDRKAYEDWKARECSAYNKDADVDIVERDDFRNMVRVKKSGDWIGNWVHSYDVY